MKTSVIIATNNRARDLEECLESLDKQSRKPDEVIIAHGGADRETQALAAGWNAQSLNLKYFNFGPLGAARQRNAGAEKSSGDILFFLDDDVICEPAFIQKITEVFESDKEGKTGGVSGIVVNQSYVDLSRLNKFLFDICVPKKERAKSYAGKIVGPAVNFLPRDISGTVQQVDWMPSCVCAYRRQVFMEARFNEKFRGYSFMEDVELSARTAKKYRLVNTTDARLYHKDLGGKSHKSVYLLGEMQSVNRWHVMRNVLGKKDFFDPMRFFYYQIIYCTIVEAGQVQSLSRLKDVLIRTCGRLHGFISALIFKHNSLGDDN